MKIIIWIALALALAADAIPTTLRVRRSSSQDDYDIYDDGITGNAVEKGLHLDHLATDYESSDVIYDYADDSNNIEDISQDFGYSVDEYGAKDRSTHHEGVPAQVETSYSSSKTTDATEVNVTDNGSQSRGSSVIDHHQGSVAAAAPLEDHGVQALKNQSSSAENTVPNYKDYSDVQDYDYPVDFDPAVEGFEDHGYDGESYSEPGGSLSESNLERGVGVLSAKDVSTDAGSQNRAAAYAHHGGQDANDGAWYGGNGATMRGLEKGGTQGSVNVANVPSRSQQNGEAHGSGASSSSSGIGRRAGKGRTMTGKANQHTSKPRPSYSKPRNFHSGKRRTTNSGRTISSASRPRKVGHRRTNTVNRGRAKVVNRNTQHRNAASRRNYGTPSINTGMSYRHQPQLVYLHSYPTVLLI